MFYKRVLFAVLCCVFSFCSSRSLAQGTSNKGTDFWLGYGNHIGATSQRMDLYITSDVNTTGTVTIGATNIPFTVTANAITTVNIPQSAYLGVQTGKITGKGIHLTAIKPIVAYAHIYDNSVSGATLVLPTNTLGKEYYSINYDQVSNAINSYSYFFVVATEDNTQIEITPSAATQVAGLTTGVKSAPITLMKGDIYNVLGTQTSASANPQIYKGTDLTGSIIKSVSTTSEPCKKIAVFSGSGKISIGCFSGAAGSADNLFQQVYPTATWGRTFVTVPEKGRNYDIYRVFKSDPAAVVKLNGAIISSASFKNNLYYDFPSATTNYIESDKPIQVVQYAVTQNQNLNCTTKTDPNGGDPEMIYLNPLEQTLSNLTMYSSPKNLILAHYINVVIKTSDASSFLLDGVNQGSKFVAVPNLAGYSYAQLSVTPGTHNLFALGGFNATAYGFGSAESYGYAAGANLVSKGIQAQVGTTKTIKTTGCINEPYDFKVTLGYQPTKLMLDMGDGNPPANLAITLDTTYVENGSPQYVYILTQNTVFNSSKTFNIRLYAEKPNSDGCGSVDQFDLDYTVYPVPIPSFTTSTQQPCIASPVTLTNTSADNGNAIVKWFWNYGDGTTEIRTDGNAFTHQYAQPGDYNVTLKVEGTSGCQSAATAPTVIHVNKIPEAKFTYPSITCQDQPVAFTDQSIANEGTVTKWNWDFGDANATSANPNTSTAQNPSHSFSQPGNYSVKLTVETDKGCVSIISTQTLTINYLPVPDFELPLACLTNGTAAFTNKTTIADGTGTQLTYVWNFGDSFSTVPNNTSTQASPSHMYTKAGTYTIILTAKSSNGCEISTGKQFTITGSDPVAAFNTLNLTKLCSNQPVNFEDKSTIAFGEITRIDWYYDYANNPTVFETDNSPALRSASAKQYSHTYPTFNTPLTKNYTVRMVAYSGSTCVDDEIKTITLQAVPIADFDMPDFCLSDGAAQFSNKSSIANGTTGLTYVWDFGDQFANPQRPNTSTSANPAHAYTKVGIYTVTLTATSSSGCTNVFTKQFTVNGSTPKAVFNVLNPTALCSNQPVQFQDLATVDFGEVTRIDWYYDFGNNPTVKVTDDTPAMRADPARIYSHTYPTFNTPLTKNYTVKMVAFSGSGTNTSCVNEIIKTITVKAVPKPDFTSSASCLTDGTAQFTDKTTIVSGGEPFTYLWDFGDANANAQHPNTSTAKDPAHTFAAAGTYQVSLTATAANGCQETIVKPFIVTASIPKPDFNVINVSNLCSDQAVVFEDKGSIAFGEITRIDWYYDYANNPTAVTTDNSPALRSAPSKSYTHTYPSFSTPLSKTYKVRMVAYSGTTCVAEISKDIVLKAIPTVTFDLPDVCLTDGVAQFTDKSTIATGGEPFTYLWDFGDKNATSLKPNTSTAQNASHTYSASGTYQVTLTVTAANGCSSTLIKPLTISGSIPKPDFNVINSTQLCSDQPVVFEDIATLAFSEITKIEWYFDHTNHAADPQYIQIDNTPNLRSGNVKQYSFLYPVFHSPLSQTVSVRMKAFSGQTCVAEIIKPITLKAVPLVVFNPIPGICEEETPIDLTEASETTSFPGSGTYSGPGTNSSGHFDPQAAGVGVHTITYTFTGSNGCVNIQTQTISVYKTPTVDAGKDQIILLGGQANLSPAATGSNLTYKWSPATGLSQDDIANPTAKPDDDITYTITVTTDEGCTARDDIFIKVLKSPEVPNTFTPNDDGINDTWNIKYLESYPGATVEIFNRYGTKIYSNSSGYTQAWDGKLNGELLPAGTYYYIINPKNGKKIMSGQVTIVR